MVCLVPAGFCFAFLLNLSILDVFVEHVGSVEFSRFQVIVCFYGFLYLFSWALG